MHQDNRRGQSNEGAEPSDRRITPDLETTEVAAGRRPGTRYVRIVRPFAREFRRRGRGELIATERVLAPRTPARRALETLRRVLIGRRIPTERELHERVGVLKGLVILSPDAMSSAAYGPEEIMRVLAVAGAAALSLTFPVAAAITVLLAIVATSYRQTVLAYPTGGGSYIVASDNLGRLPGLVAAAALLTDYVLTVAVSVTAGVAAVVSAFPDLFPYRVGLSVGAVTLLALANLRGIREAANLFLVPVYLYIFSLLGLVGLGLYQIVTGTVGPYEPPPRALTGTELGAEALSVFLMLRAFASGSVALTGVEAIANGVPIFKPPEGKHAAQALILLALIYGAILLGIGFIAAHLQVIPDPEEVETVLSQVARTLADRSWFYYLVQFATMGILLIAANTAFADFPRLASILAKDMCFPRFFARRGDRLAFDNGIILLAALAVVLIVAFGGSVTQLVPLYAVGVFVAFTLSQAGMVVHWRREKGPGWRLRAAVNGLGALATGVVTVVVGATKFALGAWVVIVVIPTLVALMLAIHRHYRFIEDMLTIDRPEAALRPLRGLRVVVPVAWADRAALNALAFARQLASDVVAVHVSPDSVEAARLRRRWAELGIDLPLVVIDSPYRAVVEPLLAFIDALRREDPKTPVVVVLPGVVPRCPWQYLLHNLTALRLKLALFFRPNVVVVDVPYHLGPAEEW
jgi:amino acid transporter